MSDGLNDALRGTYFKKKNMKNLEKLPDPDKHQKISFLKSGIRIFGYVCLFFSIEAAASFLIASEIVGIYEETV